MYLFITEQGYNPIVIFDDSSLCTREPKKEKHRGKTAVPFFFGISKLCMVGADLAPGAAGAAAVIAFGTAFAAVGAADAFIAVLLGFINIKNRKTDYCSKNKNDDYIFHSGFSFLEKWEIRILQGVFPRLRRNKR